MSEEQKSPEQEEALGILNNCRNSIQNRYALVREAYINHYEYPELDPLRHEITLAITLGLNQAAITLTNHMLESALKNVLFAFHSRAEKGKSDANPLKGFMDAFKPAIKKYGKMNLNQTIDETFKIEMITEDERAQLHNFRKYMRNAYGHADKAQTFREAQTTAQTMSIDEKGLKVDTPQVVRVDELLPAQGIFQAMIAENDAPEYFLSIDKIVRSMLLKVFPGYLDEVGETNNREV